MIMSIHFILSLVLHIFDTMIIQTFTNVRILAFLCYIAQFTLHCEQDGGYDCGIELRAMGIPKFYRWISERYPCLSQVIAQQQVKVPEYEFKPFLFVAQIPDFDNLYLDMNGIIHTCTHPNDDDPHFRLSEEAMFNDIFHYIEVRISIVIGAHYLK